jgi:nickel transport protein
MNTRMVARIFGALAFLLAAAPVSAHRVNLFAWVEGGTVYVESRFPDGTKVHEGLIQVLDSAGKELLSGKTNDQGEFSFKIPKQDNLTIVLEAGMGHRTEWPLSRQDLAAGEATDPATAAAPSAAPSSPAPTPAAPPSSAAASAGVEQAVEKALDKKLAPVIRMLAEMNEPKVRLTDVLGGLGYIFGLVGVAAYFKRKPS